MTNTETINATSMPTINMAASIPVKDNPNFNIFNKLAPNMTGIARQKVNSEAAVRDTPTSRAPTMVAPDRDVPGNTAAIN